LLSKQKETRFYTFAALEQALPRPHPILYALNVKR
jgi:hypothetical protein